MSGLSKNNALLELENVRRQLLELVNGKIDALIERIQNGEEISAADTPQGVIFPLSFDPHYFKGKKPTAVLFGEESIKVSTWRDAHNLILRWCDDEKHDALMALRNRIAGRERVFLSDKPDGMNIPIKINEGLFAEGKFDSEYRVIILRQILDAAQYDYSGISVVIKDGGQ